MPNEKDPDDGTTCPEEAAKEPAPTVEDNPKTEPSERVRSRIQRPAGKIKRWVN